MKLTVTKNHTQTLQDGILPALVNEGYEVMLNDASAGYYEYEVSNGIDDVCYLRFITGIVTFTVLAIEPSIYATSTGVYDFIVALTNEVRDHIPQHEIVECE